VKHSFSAGKGGGREAAGESEIRGSFHQHTFPGKTFRIYERRTVIEANNMLDEFVGRVEMHISQREVRPRPIQHNHCQHVLTHPLFSPFFTGASVNIRDSAQLLDEPAPVIFRLNIALLRRQSAARSVSASSRYNPSPSIA
jgi:hypothetical protein